jgi:hypothetical protein
MEGPVRDWRSGTRISNFLCRVSATSTRRERLDQSQILVDVLWFRIAVLGAKDRGTKYAFFLDEERFADIIDYL